MVHESRPGGGPLLGRSDVGDDYMMKQTRVALPRPESGAMAGASQLADLLGSSVAGVAAGLFGLCVCIVLVRFCRRRYRYRKVQRTMDEEELAFQKSLAKNYSEEMAELDDSERYARRLLASPEVRLFNRRATAVAAQRALEASGELHG